MCKELLLNFFNQCSVLESDPRFLETCRVTLGDRLHTTFECRLQEYTCSAPQVYDFVWIQWVAMYGSDSNLQILFF